MAISASHFILYAPEFTEVLGVQPTFEKLLETSAHEGPVYFSTLEALYFTSTPVNSDVPIAGSRDNKLMCLNLKNYNQGGDVSENDLSVVLSGAESNLANGMIQGKGLQLLICEQGNKSQKAIISSLNLETNVKTVVCDNWQLLPFNSPNDIVVHPDGSIWFTDPSYGFNQGFRNEPLIGSFVYRYDPVSETVTVVDDSFDKPNGIVFSVDGTKLYITDSGANQGDGKGFQVNRPHHIRVFDVKDGKLSNGRLFAVVSPGIPDGIKVDTQDKIYVSSASGVKVYSPEAKLLGEFVAPGVANFTFGGKNYNDLFILTDDAIWVANIEAQGFLLNRK